MQVPDVTARSGQPSTWVNLNSIEKELEQRAKELSLLGIEGFEDFKNFAKDLTQDQLIIFFREAIDDKKVVINTLNDVQLLEPGHQKNQLIIEIVKILAENHVLKGPFSLLPFSSAIVPLIEEMDAAHADDVIFTLMECAKWDYEIVLYPFSEMKNSKYKKDFINKMIVIFVKENKIEDILVIIETLLEDEEDKKKAFESLSYEFTGKFSNPLTNIALKLVEQKKLPQALKLVEDSDEYIKGIATIASKLNSYSYGEKPPISISKELAKTYSIREAVQFISTSDVTIQAEAIQATGKMLGGSSNPFGNLMRALYKENKSISSTRNLLASIQEEKEKEEALKHLGEELGYYYDLVPKVVRDLKKENDDIIAMASFIVLFPQKYYEEASKILGLEFKAENLESSIAIYIYQNMGIQAAAAYIQKIPSSEIRKHAIESFGKILNEGLYSNLGKEIALAIYNEANFPLAASFIICIPDRADQEAAIKAIGNKLGSFSNEGVRIVQDLLKLDQFPLAKAFVAILPKNQNTEGLTLLKNYSPKK